MSPFRSSNWSGEGMKLKLEKRNGSTSVAGKGTTDPRSTCLQVIRAHIWSYCGGTSVNEFWASNCSLTEGGGASNWSK